MLLKRFRVFLLCGLLGLFGVTACNSGGGSADIAMGGVDPVTLPPLSGESLKAAEILINQLHVPINAEIIMRAVPPGTVLREDSPEEGPPAQLTVPSTAGSYYAFLIDLEPDRRLSHPFKLAFLRSNDNFIATFDADWRAFLQAPGEIDAPFRTRAASSVLGPRVREVSGTGLMLERTGPETVVTDGPIKETVDPPSPGECKKLAMICDLGDSGRREGEENLPESDRPRDVARQFAADADLFRDFVKPRGFSVTRYSQLPESAQKFARNNLQSEFLDALQSQASQFAPCPDDKPCCGEFFLYLGGHGSELRNVAVPATATTKEKPVTTGTLILYSADGQDRREIKYSLLKSALGQFPKCVKIIVFIDACHSGSAVASLQDLCNTPPGRCGVTVVAACSIPETTPGGGSSIQSATQKFMQRDDEDRDGDGKFGDFTDRFRHMRDEQAKDGCTSQAFLCAGQATMCSTD